MSDSTRPVVSGQHNLPTVRVFEFENPFGPGPGHKELMASWLLVSPVVVDPTEPSPSPGTYALVPVESLSDPAWWEKGLRAAATVPCGHNYNDPTAPCPDEGCSGTVPARVVVIVEGDEGWPETDVAWAAHEFHEARKAGTHVVESLVRVVMDALADGWPRARVGEGPPLSTEDFTAAVQSITDRAEGGEGWTVTN